MPLKQLSMAVEFAVCRRLIAVNSLLAKITLPETTRQLDAPKVGFGKRGLLEEGSFQKSPFSRDSRD